jgi:hypothetical protein
MEGFRRQLKEGYEARKMCAQGRSDTNKGWMPGISFS